MSDERIRPLPRAAFRVFRPIQTRWMDNDVYGHVNNVVYYSFVDSAVNGWLVDEGVLAIGRSPVVGLVAETQCTFFDSVAFPDALESGLSVVKLGRTSVAYRVGIFRAHGLETVALARFVHVYVERATGRPAPIPDDARAAMALIRA